MGWIGWDGYHMAGWVWCGMEVGMQLRMPMESDGMGVGAGHLRSVEAMHANEVHAHEVHAHEVHTKRFQQSIPPHVGDCHLAAEAPQSLIAQHGRLRQPGSTGKMGAEVAAEAPTPVECVPTQGGDLSRIEPG